MTKLIIITSLALALFIAVSAAAQTDPHIPTCNVNVSQIGVTTWHFDGACSGTDLAIGPLTVSISLVEAQGAGGSGSVTTIASSGTGEPAGLTLSGSGDIVVNVFCIPPGQYTAQIQWSVDYSSCSGGTCGGDPSRIYQSGVGATVGNFAMPLGDAEVGATLQATVDPTVVYNGFTPNVSLAYTFGTYTASNYILIFSTTSQVAQRFLLSGSGIWNLVLGPGSYSARAVVCGGRTLAVAAFTVAPLPPPQHGGIPALAFQSSGACTTPPCDDRILASIAPWDHYESQYQVPSPSPGSAAFKIRGSLVDSVTHQPKAATVYLRLDDPDDTAPYVVAAGDQHSPNDGPCASFVGSTPGTACQAPFAVQADANGSFEATVLVPIPVAGATAAAGNNYQITASADPAFACAGINPCAKSGVFTLWKRVYVEEEHMFRAGAFIVERAAPPAGQIVVSSDVPFRGLTPGVSQLRLVHASTGAPGDSFYADPVTFDGIQPGSTGSWIVRIHGTLPRAYGVTVPSGTVLPAAGLLRDGVGVVQAGTYDPNTAYTSPLLESAFIELRSVPPLAVTETPYAPEIPLGYAFLYSSRWLQHRATTALPGAVIVPASDNVFHRNGITQTPLIPPAHAGMRWGAELGETVVNAGAHYSSINVQRIADLAAGTVRDPHHNTVGVEYHTLPALKIDGETTAHETVHFWVHTGSVDGVGHCASARWQHDGRNCLMHTPYAGTGLADGFVDLHYGNHGGDSEYMQIRRTADPVPQQ